MKTRHLTPERMDNPDLPVDEHRLALKGLRRINQFTRLETLTWHPILRLATRCKRQQLRILDIGTGAADVPIALWHRARRHGLDLKIEACDISPTAIEFAAANVEQAGAAIHVFRLDVLAADIEDSFDVVTCSQFLHHLEDSAAVHVLRKMMAAATHQLVVVDLIRSRWNWLQVLFATHVLSRSKVVRDDGLRSVRAAFTTAEVENLAKRSEIGCFRVEKHWPCRFVLIGEHS